MLVVALASILRDLPLGKAALAFAVLSLAACADSKPSQLIALRPALGGIVVASAPGAAAELSAVPAKGGGAGALAGAGEGFKLGAVVAIAGGTAGDARALLVSVPLGLVTAVVATPVGAVIGAAKARSKVEVEAAEAAIRKALAATAPHPHLAEALRNLPGMVPNLRTYEVVPAGGYNALAARDIATVLEVTAGRYGLAKVGLGAADPDFRLVVTAKVRLVRVSDSAELYATHWQYAGATHEFFSWAERDGALVRAELDRAYRDLALRIARHLFSDPEPAKGPIITVYADPRRPPSRPAVSQGAPADRSLPPRCSEVGGHAAHFRNTGTLCRCDNVGGAQC